MYTSTYAVKWICSTCSGEYLDVINNHTFGSTNCPYCNNRRALPGLNSFQDKHPDLIEYWDFVANIYLVQPNEILDNSTTPVWWYCSDNRDHKFRMPVKRILYYKKRHMKVCPYCKGRNRKRRHFI